MLDKLNNYNIILASKSPRRQELLKGIGLNFNVLTKDVDESYPSRLSVYEVAPYLSLKKAKAFEDAELPDNYMIITADTIVVVGDEILGKPKDKENACEMLLKLSGKKHSVITGVTIRTKDRTKTFSAVSNVVFEKLDSEELWLFKKEIKGSSDFFKNLILKKLTIMLITSNLLIKLALTVYRSGLVILVLVLLKVPTLT